jgi:hypothetical protein
MDCTTVEGPDRPTTRTTREGEGEDEGDGRAGRGTFLFGSGAVFNEAVGTAVSDVARV